MAARKSTTVRQSPTSGTMPTTSNGLFSVTETEAVVKSNNPGRGESPLTLAIREAVATAISTGKTYATGETWGDGGKPATKQGVNVVQTLQREGRKANVTVKVGSDSKDGKRLNGSHIIFVTAPKISRPRKDKGETK